MFIVLPKLCMHLPTLKGNKAYESLPIPSCNNYKILVTPFVVCPFILLSQILFFHNICKLLAPGSFYNLIIM